MSKFYWILGFVAVVGLAIVGYTVGSGVVSQAVVEPVDLGDIQDDPSELMALARPVMKGNPDAAITLFEFADFQCPACATYARQFGTLVDQGYIQNGRVRLAYYDFPLISIHPHAFLAARAGRCAEDQDAFWEYHDRLFETQARWSPQSDPTGTFIGFAEELGLSKADFETCLKSDRHARLITAQMQLAEQLRVGGTPTLMISQGGMGTRIPSFDFQTVSAALDEALARVEGEGN
jgi:protein-disulfide isomerase